MSSHSENTRDTSAPPIQRRRESLTQRGGPVETRGDEKMARELATALEGTDSDETQDLTHGFHTYPARMHPRLARELIASWAQPGDVVLDPFCGSGTVLVEALVAGCRPQGVDLNPVALRISEVHCALKSQNARRQFEQNVKRVAHASEERVRGRARAHIGVNADTQALYQPHILFELCGLREEIEVVPYEDDRRAMLVVFSSLLVKFSRLRADTSREQVDKRLRKGLVTEFFMRKTFELVQRWEALFESAPKEAFPARLMCGDARDLPNLLGPRFQADLVVTSPPYGGTYDYADQHALRADWFGFDTSSLRSNEIGARRTARDADALDRWDDELRAVLRSVTKLLRPDGRVVLWMGDADMAGRKVQVAQQVAALAPHAGLQLMAAASQSRGDPRGGQDRSERLLLLQRV